MTLEVCSGYTYVDIKLQNQILLASSFQPGDLRLQLVLRHWLPWLLLLRRQVMVSARLRPAVLLGVLLLLLVWVVVRLLLLILRLLRPMGLLMLLIGRP